MEKLKFSIKMDSWNEATIVSFSSFLAFGGGVFRYPLSVSSLNSVEGIFLWYKPFTYDELGTIFGASNRLAMKNRHDGVVC